MNSVDDPETGTEENPMDEALPYPGILARVINVTVDGAPYMSNSAVGSVELDVAAVDVRQRLLERWLATCTTRECE